MCGSLDAPRTRCTKQTTKLPRPDCGAEHEGRHVLIAPGFGRLLTGFRPIAPTPFRRASAGSVARDECCLGWCGRVCPRQVLHHQEKRKRAPRYLVPNLPVLRVVLERDLGQGRVVLVLRAFVP